MFESLYPQGNAPEFTAPLNVVKVTVDRAATEQGQLMLATEYTPTASRMTDYFTRGTEPTISTTYWSLPQAPVITGYGLTENTRPYISFSQDNATYITVVYRSDDNGSSWQEAVRFAPGHGTITWEDSSVQRGQKYTYYLQSLLPDSGNTVIAGEKTPTLSIVVPAWDDFFFRFFGR